MKKLIFAVFFICLLGFAAAGFPYNDYPTKWALCNILNFTGMACDSWWEAFAELPAANATIDLSAYYNKTEIDLIVSKVNMTLQNVTPDLSGYATTDYVNNKTGELQNSVMNNYVSNTTFEGRMNAYKSPVSSSNGVNPTTIIIIVAIVVVLVIVGLNFMQKQQHPVPPTRVENPITNRIKNRQQIEEQQEEEIEEEPEPKKTDKYEQVRKDIKEKEENIKKLKKELGIK